MNTYKNGRQAIHLDQIVGVSSGLAGPDGKALPGVAVGKGHPIAGTVQIAPNQEPAGTGIVHVQDKNGMHCHIVHLADCFHAEDALLAIQNETPAAPAAAPTAPAANAS